VCGADGMNFKATLPRLFKSSGSCARLPDGLFSTQNPNLGKFLEGLAILVYFMTIWSIFTAIGNILWPFGIFCGNLVYFSPFGYFGPRKIWQPCPCDYSINCFLSDFHPTVLSIVSTQLLDNTSEYFNGPGNTFYR
jgi:hypothetical protein